MFRRGNLFAIFAVQMLVIHAIVSTPLTNGYWDYPRALPVAKRAIDKSCIMMCDRWGSNACEKWVMRCKGDPGYPKTVRQLERAR